MSRPEDYAWVAGFIDGEGTFGASPGAAYSHGRRYLRLSVSQKYRPLLDRVHEIVGCGSVYGGMTTRGRSEFKFQAGSGQAFDVACRVWPWLGEQKKRDFIRAIGAVRETRANADAIPVLPRACAASDCRSVFTPDKLHKSARFCSNVCSERYRRRSLPRTPRFCRGCGCNVDERTKGCQRCSKRHWQRRATAERS